MEKYIEMAGTKFKQKSFYLYPSYSSYHFFIHDSDYSIYNIISDASYYDVVLKERFYQKGNLIIIGTKSDFLGIKITIKIFNDEPPVEVSNSWVKTIKTSIDFSSGEIDFFDPPDGVFSNIKVPKGEYFLNIYYGEKTPTKEGLSNDYYLIKIWPNNNKKIINHK